MLLFIYYLMDSAEIKFDRFGFLFNLEKALLLLLLLILRGFLIIFDSTILSDLLLLQSEFELQSNNWSILLLFLLKELLLVVGSVFLNFFNKSNWSEFVVIFVVLFLEFYSLIFHYFIKTSNQLVYIVTEK